MDIIKKETTNTRSDHTIQYIINIFIIKIHPKLEFLIYYSFRFISIMLKVNINYKKDNKINSSFVRYFMNINKKDNGKRKLIIINKNKPKS